MGLQERIQAKRHEDHARAGRSEESCPSCVPDRRAPWTRRDLAKDLTTR